MKPLFNYKQSYKPPLFTKMNTSVNTTEYALSDDYDKYENLVQLDSDGNLSHNFIRCTACKTISNCNVKHCINKKCNFLFSYLPSGYINGAEREGFNCDQEQDVSSDEDDAEEVMNDYITCITCHVKTHIALKKCSKCNVEFKFSSTGYCISGVDGEFISDDVDDDADDASSVELEYNSNDDDDESDSDDDDGTNWADDGDSEVEYVPKDNSDDDEPQPKRARQATRSSKG
jgi:hypothetical protein